MYQGGLMANSCLKLVWVFLLIFLAVGIWCIGYGLSGIVEQNRQEKEQCIVWKYEKNAQKFLDNNCTAYVRWNQDNN